jgi:hypothetical protein
MVLGPGLNFSDRDRDETETVGLAQVSIESVHQRDFQSDKIKVLKQEKVGKGKSSERLLQHSRSVAYRKP